MAATPREEKLTAVFNAFDQDGNGYLEPEDFQAVVDELAEEFGLKGSRRHRALANSFHVLWDELLLHGDTDNDQSLSLAEFVDSYEQAIADSSRVNVVDYIGSAMFDVVDADGDGYVDGEQFGRLQRAFRVTEESASQTFTAADADGDGRLTQSEFLQGFRHYFTTSNYNKPGSWFFGKPD
ncbi:EF-hand domain-containing protein [Streptomyces sp. TS71-3]|uniref:EF-hand domain-containing protein n=1 Tax=Streptomyces sp. TS71-3 TaxID=2733862 RepID=UPI001B0DC16C|nr:EF-hand domain-containing protein [Streptomyces sp. TS71-3]GHJ35660.1 calcium-binding protein [Streptomyces sp. TS71-3]